MSTLDRFAVVGVGGVWVSDGTFAPSSANPRLSAILTWARNAKVGQVWMHPSVTPQGTTWLEAFTEARTAGWQLPDEPKPWLTTWQPGTYGAVTLAITELEERVPWGSAERGAALMRSLLAYQEHVGIPFAYSPGVTGIELMRRLHTGKGTLDLAASIPPSAFPAVVRDQYVELDFSPWLRSLTATERAHTYLHAYDKNAQYLSACSSLALGFGRPEHITGPLFDKRTPGYWHVTVARPEGLSPLLPFTVGAGRYVDANGTRWMTTPTLTLAMEISAVVEIHEGWLWPEPHRPLEPWYKRLRDARAALRETDRPAYEAVKATYAHAIGYLDGNWLRPKDEPADLYRPDWRHAIIATARCNLFRNASRILAESERAPVGIVQTDTMLFTSDDVDPITAAPAGMRLGDTPGLYKPKWSVPMRHVGDVLDTIGPADGWNAASTALHERVKQWQSR